jgi:hypothetical protein
MGFRLLWYWTAALALVLGPIGLMGIAPVWASLLFLAIMGIVVCIWIILLFGPAEPVYGQRGGGD